MWSDNETVSYGDIRISLRQIRELICTELEEAEKSFRRYLYFELDGVPECDMSDYAENWKDDRLALSFFTYGRNTELFE